MSKVGCQLCNGTGQIDDCSYPNVLFAGCVPMFVKVCPRCKGHPKGKKEINS